MIAQGEVRWCDLPAPTGSGPARHRPMVVIQGEAFNRSRISTVVCVVVTSNLNLLDAPGNVLLEAATSGLPKDSVANVSQLFTLDRRQVGQRAGRLPSWCIEEIFQGIDMVLGRREV